MNSFGAAKTDVTIALRYSKGSARVMRVAMFIGIAALCSSCATRVTKDEVKQAEADYDRALTDMHSAQSIAAGADSNFRSATDASDEAAWRLATTEHRYLLKNSPFGFDLALTPTAVGQTDVKVPSSDGMVGPDLRVAQGFYFLNVVAEARISALSQDHYSYGAAGEVVLPFFDPVVVRLRKSIFARGQFKNPLGERVDYVRDYYGAAVSVIGFSRAKPVSLFFNVVKVPREWAQANVDPTLDPATDEAVIDQEISEAEGSLPSQTVEVGISVSLYQYDPN